MQRRHPQINEQENRHREIFDMLTYSDCNKSLGHKHKIRSLQRTEKIKKICKPKCYTCQTSHAVLVNIQAAAELFE